MSGYVKRRAKSQRRRSLLRAWGAGWRPSTADTVTSRLQFTSVAPTMHVSEGRIVGFTLKGQDLHGNDVEEYLETPHTPIRSRQDMLVAYGLRNPYVHIPHINKINLPTHQPEEST